jgi:pre-mRNA-splicing factor RBM22/SLT11
MTTERGLQSKSDSVFSQADNGDFPILCEGCLGDTPYVRMQKNTLAGQCKMCDRPFTVFKWRPGRGEGYKKTEVCQVCSKVKNLCQTCILDLQFGLPSQLRDAVLANEGNGIAAPESDVHREYHARQHLALLNSGQDPWQDDNTPNEQLLRIARGASTQNRENSRIKMPIQGVKRQRRLVVIYVSC